MIIDIKRKNSNAKTTASIASHQFGTVPAGNTASTSTSTLSVVKGPASGLRISSNTIKNDPFYSFDPKNAIASRSDLATLDNLTRPFMKIGTSHPLRLPMPKQTKATTLVATSLSPIPHATTSGASSKATTTTTTTTTTTSSTTSSTDFDFAMPSPSLDDDDYSVFDESFHLSPSGVTAVDEVEAESSTLKRKLSDFSSLNIKFNTQAQSSSSLESLALSGQALPERDIKKIKTNHHHNDKDLLSSITHNNNNNNVIKDCSFHHLPIEYLCMKCNLPVCKMCTQSSTHDHHSVSASKDIVRITVTSNDSVQQEASVMLSSFGPVCSLQYRGGTLNLTWKKNDPFE
ncbi:hypothetical protein SAMD00019534_062930 [Acytostelium subglobosum LB1]|uniref:hypothetical protein n=1 Tax=Acytostelium subglobosum LB1 TaxID=1410327 RepID=UPI000645107F|nr:hypothetical protein SAMD00019534_062930 [Acytostelium subglobosum LB1]GAM23118.1 hypothetical protein SAMD00019534_062930 [Acytostelium subglobosum LB1]|eukprot:XP_012754345.1 hypothetical protein SAMD00019534_062930 [Acytostelium subglobosum LB1]